MSADLLIGLFVSVGLLLGGLVLGGVWIWSRAGRSRAARWWVRRGPITELRGAPTFEGLAMVLLPLFAQVLLLLALVAVAGPMISPLTGPMLWAALAVALVQAALCVVAHFAWWQRRILPLWAYPSWLRELRRQERELDPHASLRRSSSAPSP